MIICPNCDKLHDSAAFQACPCGYELPVKNGLTLWHSLPDDIHYGAEGFEVLSAHESGHFWFLARTALLRHCLKKYFADFTSILDVGCGTGFVLSKISSDFPHARLHGSDIFAEALNMAAAKSPQCAFMQMDARKIPYREEFDVITACDVLEHIDEDGAALDGFYRALRPGGGVILTVPQHPGLWSGADAAASHVRRYKTQELSGKVKKAGFQILLNTSFVSLLLPALIFSRLRAKGAANPQGGELEISPGLNRFLAKIMQIERWLILRGLRLPAGGSRLVVAKKSVLPAG